MRCLPWLLPTILIAACTAVVHHQLDEDYGLPDPARFDHHSDTVAARHAWEQVQPVFEHRCAVCHGCYDSPCQLKLTGYDGITRGGSKEQVYATRLLAATPTRLHIDAQTDVEWRKRGFHPVLNERRQTTQADREGSVLYRMLALKRKQGPQPAVLSSELYDFSLDRKQVCATIEEMTEFESNHPDWGMPYGMPQLSADEYRTLTDWVEKGAPYAPPPALAPAYTERINLWESFLNGDSLKSQLVSRYIYEHWYLAHFYFDDLPTREFFELVRSKTPPGTPIDLVATVGPYDDPGVARVYYRLRRVQEALLAKTHMPFALGAGRMAKLRSWFFEPDYPVSSLPSYEPKVASNPFVAFEQLPVRARYRLMLDEAQFTIMNFIKGPVCRGQVALNVIDDYFWVTFLDPDSELTHLSSHELAGMLKEIHLPAEDDGALPLIKWRHYAEAENAFLKAKAEFLNQHLDAKDPPKLSMLWDGDGNNDNAALTIFRHFDSATVVQGLIGTSPQTAWVISYSLLERIHYLLVAGYDVYSNVGHQVTTRMYMDFLRMEGEDNFLDLLPLSVRDEVHEFWYRGATDEVKDYRKGHALYYASETGVRYRTKQPLNELYGLLQKQLMPVLNHRYDLPTKGVPAATRQALIRLGNLKGLAVSHLPEIVFLTLTNAAGVSDNYSLLHNDAHRNISTLFHEEENRLPEEDTVTLVDGFLGAYPNVFTSISAKELPDFVDAVSQLQSESDYQQLIGRYGIRRTDARFWSHSDALDRAYRHSAPIEAGLFDYNRYDNR